MISFLVIANLLTLGFFWWNRWLPFDENRGPRNFLIKELQLNANQQLQYEVLIKEHRKNTRDLKIKISDSREQLYDLLKDKNLSDSGKYQAAEFLSHQLMEIELVNLNHFQNLRDLCNASQKQKFDELLHDLSRIMLKNNQQGNEMHMPPPSPGEHENNPMPPSPPNR